ncbi:uroporphyrinogen-III synthase [Alkalimarinus coralli]|uniref:uroporphyrinogen-III synthase n=1 Tax=Alkalimarinus coralli TaxID=2935863 RepID=UPI00202B5A8A|nr:uroporphyrinogen-III synthase [Alkalimarinus coralli]
MSNKSDPDKNLQPPLSNSTSSLKGVRVLVARPHEQGAALTAHLNSLGADALQFPTITIEPVSASNTKQYATLKDCFLNLDHYHHIIAVSTHAAHYGLQWIDQYWPQLPLDIKWYAVGEKTARTLLEADIVATASQKGYDSESLLNLSELAILTDQRVLILRGAGGRELIKEQLELRGAKVDYADLYQRNCPQYTVSEINEALITFSPDILIALSGETLHNLVKISQNKDIALKNTTVITDKAVIVPSERVADQARRLGFSSIWVPKGLHKQALVDCITSNYFL